MLSPDRLFDPEPTHRRLARQLYERVDQLPIVSPHGHVEASLFAEPDRSFGSPVDLFILHDHYIYRMLYSQGVVPSPLLPGNEEEGIGSHRKTWQAFVDSFYLFQGTPSGLWIRHELEDVFGVEKALISENAQSIYDQVDDCLKRAEFRPRALFERFNIQVLCTTDAATDPLNSHAELRNSGWKGKIRPTFRPDALVNLLTPKWKENLASLMKSSGVNVVDVPSFIRALEVRRQYFKEMGGTATDHAAEKALTETLSPGEVGTIFQNALKGEVSPVEAEHFTAHMMVEMARMSVEDGLVMQFHVGCDAEP